MACSPKSPALLRLLLCLALSVGCTADTIPESARWVEGLARQPVLRAAAVGQDGLVHLAIFQNSTFEFTIKGPAGGVVVGQEIDVTSTPGWQVAFTAMVPGGPGLPAAGAGPNGDGAECETVVDETGDDKLYCDVPYVAYGDHTPVPLTIEAGTVNGSALLCFQEFGSEDGEEIRVEVMYSLSRAADDGSCQVYHRYTTGPLRFVMGAVVSEDDEVTPGSPVAGPIFPIDTTDDDGEVHSHSPECALEEVPLTYRNYCPLPDTAISDGPLEGTWFWYDRCLSAAAATE